MISIRCDITLKILPSYLDKVIYHDICQNMDRLCQNKHTHMPIHPRVYLWFLVYCQKITGNKITRDAFFIYCPLCIIKIFFGRYSTILQEIF